MYTLTLFLMDGKIQKIGHLIPIQIGAPAPPVHYCEVRYPEPACPCGKVSIQWIE
jgi:hypothetical protein